QTQTSQRPATRPPANRVSNRSGGLGAAGALRKSNRAPVVVSSKKVKLLPQRPNLLSQVTAARDAENAIAQSIRVHATNAITPIATSASITPAISTAGLLASSRGPARI